MLREQMQPAIIYSCWRKEIRKDNEVDKKKAAVLIIIILSNVETNYWVI